MGAFTPSTEQQQKLKQYLALLQKWNGVYNLTAIRKPEEMQTLHMNDCLAIVPHFPDAGRVLDVGTGGGLPGVVLAICKPQLQVTLCDAVQKKCAFLLQVKGELGLDNVQVVHARVEDLKGEFDVITSRAFAELAQMTALTRHLLAPQGQWLAMKAIQAKEELKALPENIHAQLLPIAVQGLDATRYLIKLTRAHA